MVIADDANRLLERGVVGPSALGNPGGAHYHLALRGQSPSFALCGASLWAVESRSRATQWPQRMCRRCELAYEKVVSRLRKAS